MAAAALASKGCEAVAKLWRHIFGARGVPKLNACAAASGVVSVVGMAKKTQQTRSVPAKKHAARTPPPAAAGSKRRTQEAPAIQAAAPGSESEQPRSGTSLRVVTTEAARVVDESALPVRWPNLPPGAREVLELYEQRANELCFPGVTFESLAAKANRIDQLSENVEKARLELAAAQAAQQAAETEVVEATRRAFAYAVVYAQEHAELRTDLEAFVYASADKPRRKKREVQEGHARGKRDADSPAGEAASAGETED